MFIYETICKVSQFCVIYANPVLKYFNLGTVTGFKLLLCDLKYLKAGRGKADWDAIKQPYHSVLNLNFKMD
jgi:hypothetical protein